MPQDRSLLALLRETLTEKRVRRYFPNPANPQDPNGNVSRLSEILESALWWLGSEEQIELEDSASYSIPANGRLYLGRETTSKVRQVISVEQGDELFEEARLDWSDGTPGYCGDWKVYKRYLYALGLYQDRLPFMRYRNGGGEYRVYVNQPLVAGPIMLRYYGIPEETDIIDVGKYRRAVIDYAMYLAIGDILAKELRPQTIVDTEGIPEIRFNEKEVRKEASERLASAKHALCQTHVFVSF